jgi:hypothetical protein
MPLLKRGWILVALFGLFGGSIALIGGYRMTREREVREFYETHKLMAALDSASRKGMSPETLRSVLLAQTPLGQSYLHAAQELAQEGFGCTSRHWDISRRNYVIGCSVRDQPRQIGAWDIQLYFDQNEELVNAAAVRFKS